MNNKKTVMTLMALLAFIFNLQAQTFDSPAKYNDFLVKQNSDLIEANLNFQKVSAHSENEIEIETMRKQIVKQLDYSIKAVNNATPYEGDAKLKNEALSVLKLYKQAYAIDFVNLSKLSSKSKESYEAMEEYMKTKEKAFAKVNKAAERFDAAQIKFAKKHDMEIVSREEDQRSKEIKMVNELNSYMNKAFLIKFKVDKYTSIFWDNLKAKKYKAAQNSAEELYKISNEALTKTNQLGTFKGNKSYQESIKKYLQFVKSFSQKKLTELATLKAKLNKKQLSTEDVDKMRKDIERTNKKDPKYNDKVNKYNQAIQEYNENLKSRKKDIDRYNLLNEEWGKNSSELQDAIMQINKEFKRKYIPE